MLEFAEPPSPSPSLALSLAPFAPGRRPPSLLALAGAVAGFRALVVREPDAELMCGLLRRGCLAATSLACVNQAESCAFNLVLLARVGPNEDLENLARQTRRALAPGGRLAARLVDDEAAARLARLLRDEGFADIGLIQAEGDSFVTADRTA